MKRFFISSPECDQLINACAIGSGEKIGSIINTSILNQFLPVSTTLRTEASFLLQNGVAGDVDSWVAKQCVSRGIKWLCKHPIRDKSVLTISLSSFSFGFNRPSGHITGNNFVIEQYKKVQALLKSCVPNYSPSSFAYDGLVDDIFSHWDDIWPYEMVYDVLSTVVYLHTPFKEYSWYEALIFLKEIENTVCRQYCTD